MSNRLLRFMMFGLLCLSLVGLAACGDEEGNNGQSNNGGECSTAADCAAGQSCVNGQCSGEADECTVETEADDCESGEVCIDGACATGCREDSACSGDLVCLDDNTCGCDADAQCGEGQICVDNACEAAQVQCEAVGDDCDPNSSTEIGENFACVNTGLGPKCYASCTVPADGEPDPCSSGSFCNASGGLGSNGFCWTSQCGGVNDTEGCQDIVDANPTDYANGANCISPGNNAFVCIPAGEGAEGDACDQDNPCGEGLTCGFDGECVSFCDGDEACEEGQTCISDDTAQYTSTPGWGICGNGCESYGAAGQCGEGLGCFPITPEDGICLEAGDTPAYEACTPSKECDTNADCTSGTCGSSGFCEQPAQCEEGTRCIALNSTEARCLPVCDATQDTQAAMDATCPQGNPTAYTRFVHLAQNAGEVDIYVNGTLLIDNRAEAAGSTSTITRDFTDTEPGAKTIEVVAGDATDNSAPLASIDISVPMNAQITFAIVNAPDGSGGTALDILAVDVPRGVAAPAGGEGRFRVALDADLGTPVDVYIVDDGTLTIATETADFTDLAYGEATDFTSSMAAGDYDVYFVDAGTTPTVTGSLAMLDVALAADSTVTYHAWGNPNASGGFDSLSADALAYTEGAATSFNGYCFDLAANQGEDPSVNSGICFERCTGPEAYGLGQCTEDGDTCSTFGSNHVCLASQKAAVGDACDPGELNPCEAGAYCRSLGSTNPDGTANGVCAKQCQPSGSLNDVLTCASGEACQAIGGPDFDFGECGIPCEPTDFPSDFTSSACTTEFLESCPPHGTDLTTGDSTQAFCEPSNNVAVGDDCGEVSANNCVPDAICRREASGTLNGVLINPVQGLSNQDDGGVCRQRCELFTGDASGCPDGQACMVDGATLSSQVGFCLPADDTLADVGALETCPPASNGMMCGDGSICAELQGSSMCVKFCEIATGDGCAATSNCEELIPGGGYPLGICVPQ